MNAFFDLPHDLQIEVISRLDFASLGSFALSGHSLYAFYMIFTCDDYAAMIWRMIKVCGCSSATNGLRHQTEFDLSVDLINRMIQCPTNFVSVRSVRDAVMKHT